jgi:hypothetical protein
MMRPVWAAVAVMTGAAALLASAAQAGAAATAPAGYKIVLGSLTPAPVSALDSGTETSCPSGTVVWGGGARFQASGGAGETVETSVPAEGVGWTARVNNTTGFSQNFAVNAVCAKKPKLYKLVSAQVDNPAGAQTSATVKCPANTVVLSGGTQSSADAATVETTRAWPASKTSFTGTMFNGSTGDAKLIVEAVCGTKPAKYAIAKYTQSDSPGVTDSTGSSCPAGSSALGGGVKPAASGPTMQISSSYTENPNGWDVDITNTGSSSVQITTFAICAA